MLSKEMIATLSVDCEPHGTSIWMETKAALGVLDVLSPRAIVTLATTNSCRARDGMEKWNHRRKGMARKQSKTQKWKEEACGHILMRTRTCAGDRRGDGRSC